MTAERFRWLESLLHKARPLRDSGRWSRETAAKIREQLEKDLGLDRKPSFYQIDWHHDGEDAYVFMVDKASTEEEAKRKINKLLKNPENCMFAVHEMIHRPDMEPDDE